MNRLIEKHTPVAFLVLISLNISVLVTRGLYACVEGCPENTASLNLSSLILNVQYFCCQDTSDLYIFGGFVLYVGKPIMLFYLAVLRNLYIVFSIVFFRETTLSHL